MAKYILQEKMLLKPLQLYKLVHIPLYTPPPLPCKRKGNGTRAEPQKGCAENPSELISRPCHETPGTVAFCVCGFQAVLWQLQAIPLPTYSQQEHAAVFPSPIQARPCVHLPHSHHTCA